MKWHIPEDLPPLDCYGRSIEVLVSFDAEKIHGMAYYNYSGEKWMSSDGIEIAEPLFWAELEIEELVVHGEKCSCTGLPKLQISYDYDPERGAYNRYRCRCSKCGYTPVVSGSDSPKIALSLWNTAMLRPVVTEKDHVIQTYQQTLKRFGIPDPFENNNKTAF